MSALGHALFAVSQIRPRRRAEEMNCRAHGQPERNEGEKANNDDCNEPIVNSAQARYHIFGLACSAKGGDLHVARRGAAADGADPSNIDAPNSSPNCAKE